MNNNRNKITFKKILVNQKLGYNKVCNLVIKETHDNQKDGIQHTRVAYQIKSHREKDCQG